MTTLTAKEDITPDRIWKIWELPRGAKVQVHYVRQEKGKPDVEWECVAVFQKMDWMYWLWQDEETWEPLIFNAEFRQIDQDRFEIVEELDQEPKS